MFNVNAIDIHSGKEDFLVERLTSYIVRKYGNVSRRDVEKDLHYNDEYLNRLLKKPVARPSADTPLKSGLTAQGSFSQQLPSL